MRVLEFVLHERDRLDSASHNHIHSVMQDLARPDRHRHQARGTHPVHRHSRHALTKSRSGSGQAADVIALCSLLCRTTDDDILDSCRVQPRAGNGLGGDMA